MIQTASAEPLLSAHDFDQFRTLAYQKFGLDLPEGKEQLVAARLGKKMRELRLDSFERYYRHVVDDQTGEALVAMIDALTTNHTSFFREPAHFDFLRQTVLPELRSRDKIDIWSSACSTGEEPYTIAFLLGDELGVHNLPKVRILATDISTRVLETARRAVYAADRFQGLSDEQLRRYVLRGEREWKDRYLVKKQYREVLDFRRFNLMEPIAHASAFPVIFCRNVMIYFDRPTQQALIQRFAGCLEPGGYLFIGHAESLSGLDQPLEYVRPAIYRKPIAGAKPNSGQGRR